MPGTRRSVERPLIPNADGNGNGYNTDSGSGTSTESLADPDPVFERAHFRVADMVPSKKDKLAFGLIMAGVALFLPLTWVLILSSNPLALGYFAPHAPLNALAISALALGISPVQPPTPPPAMRQARLGMHERILAGIAVPAMVVGTSFMYYNKTVNSAPHVTTWHATFGMVTLFWMLVQASIGALSVWKDGQAFGGGMKAKAVYKYHRLSGYLLLTSALLTAFLGGMYSTWAVSRGPKYVPLRVAAFGVGLPLIFVGVVLRARTSKMRFF